MCKLSGKTQEACSALSVKLKTAIVKAYELVPEEYRQKFRNLKKMSETMDFAREK